MSNIDKRAVQAVADLKAGYILGHADVAIMNELARIALASLEAEAAAWDYELASCITCEGPQGFKRVIEHEYPPEWAIEEGRARNIVPLYAAPPAPVSVPDDSAVESLATDLMKRIDKITGERHSVATLSSMRVSIVEACRAAMFQGADGSSPAIPDGYALVPVDMTPQMMRAVQLNSELGAYAAANLSGAYSLFREFWDVAVAAAPQQEV